MPGRMVADMEQLTVTTAMIGLLAVGGKTIEALWELNAVLRKSTETINRALQEAKQCRSSVHILYKSLMLLESHRLSFPERGAWIEMDDLIATLTDTVLAFSDIQGLCDDIDDMLVATSDYEAILKQYEPKMTNLCARLRWNSVSMTMMMTILKCPGTDDAENSRASLEARVQRLLSSNMEIASRLRLLDHLFEIRGDTRYVLVSHANTLDHSTRVIRHTSVSQDIAPSRSSSWSVLSGYTLADIPAFAIIPLPVDVIDVRDGNEFYTYEYARRVSRDLDELMQDAAGQGTSKTLGVILGKPIMGIEPPIQAQIPPRKQTPTIVVPAAPTGKKKRLWR